ncbi:MAG: phosphatidylglycerol lysyltransferase domain-containing protein, partial [Pseudomonadota bacterium]
SRPDNLLALSGDKSFCFDKDQKAAVAFAEIGGARIAMGAPIGPRAQWKQVLEAFRKEAEADAARPAIYAAPPDLLPDLLDLGFKVEKIGENAILDLPSFSLSGRKREVIRRGRRKLAERAGATFRMALPPHDDALLESLEPTSKAWLAANGGREKAFSLGRFDPSFLANCPIGIVEIEGKPMAFGTLFITPDKSWAGIDLMRYDPENQVTNTMDFLLVELILWAQSESYRQFDLAMAPLSGLVEAEYAPLFARIGRLIFERGERIYNFQGLRRFKQKFDPVWEPRYIAVPGYWSVPVVLAKAALLTNGKRDDTALPSSEEPLVVGVSEQQAG